MSAPPIDLPKTIHEALEQAAIRFPNKGIAIFDGRGPKHQWRSYPDVLAAARLSACRFQTLGVLPGDRILVSLQTSWAFLDAWLGALSAGAWPVAVAPGAVLGSAAPQLRKVEGLIEQLGARFVVASPGFCAEAIGGGPGGEWPRTAAAAISPEQLEALAPGRMPKRSDDPTEVAFLQLTSGSTGSPRAVMVTHRSAMHNAWACSYMIGVPAGGPSGTWAKSLVSWLPLHHDMGLVGCLLLSLVAGHDLWLLQPSTFLARPRRWLEELGKHGSVWSYSPNFGYQLCVERLGVDERKGLDLSALRFAVSGAEMIRRDTADAFQEAFGPCGFRADAFRASYGLAEATLGVANDTKGEGLRTRAAPSGLDLAEPGLSEVACLGRAFPDTELRIVASNGGALAEERVGEVQIRGPGVFSGYYRDSEATREALDGEWLRTGDLGFLADGELYLTGRLKDLLIIHGHNLMPHEVEWTAESVTGGGGAQRSGAFSVARDGRGEEAVLVVETADRDPEKLKVLGREIRLRIAHELSLPLADLVFVRRGKLPKTDRKSVV